ncbi:RHS repeat domain-containing protein [Chryseobacterium paridis]|uniref:RHS repeat protein n=1 Tax=Chryseobacterium paridis TaxID=2800328 RepID=A0ABS1G0V4_9FLAO|nr:hypothetical protein [Chryseobacterium paridis]MBK1898280.1 hypothetical protein [Chryseobacterium paridis]
MKKNKIAVILLLASLNNVLYAQAGNNFNKDVDNINKMFPAAPTSNNLMKFEEVPVSYYTGIPDISIPLFNIPTSSPSINLNVQLKYHPLSAKPDDKAGEVGLGWNLLAGGTITRTVRGGGPDERTSSTTNSSPPRVKYGMYMHGSNPTYQLVFDQNANWDFTEYGFYAGIGKYDTEYDLYQYNFMGQTGRFIIKKDPNGNFIVEKLDRNNLKINSILSAGSDNIESIVITDDKGIKYMFKGMESSLRNISTVKIGLVDHVGNVSGNISGGAYFTSYHLDQVKDINDNVVLSFKYDQPSLVKYDDPVNTTIRMPGEVIYTNTIGGSPDGALPGQEERQTVTNTAQTKLLTNITIAGKGSINFTYEKGRSDSNYLNSVDLYKLKSVQSNITGQGIDQYVDKYSFDYDYSNSTLMSPEGLSQNLKKLLLKKITKSSDGNQNEHIINYYNISGLLKKDKWGYYSGDGIQAISQDVIKSISYPTKGLVNFNFDENVYSYFAGKSIPMEEVTGEWEIQNKDFNLTGLDSFSTTAKAEFFTLLSPQKVKLYLGFGNLVYSNWNFKIYKKLSNGTFTEVYSTGLGAQMCDQPSGGSFCPVTGVGPDGTVLSEREDEINTLQPGTYYASLSGSYGPTHKPVTYAFSAYSKESYFKSYVTKKGGGLRINNIQYFDTPISNVPAKEYVYDYKDIDNPQKSSGALVFPEPIFKYTEHINYNNVITINAQAHYECISDTTTNFNVIPSEKTQGSDVGYKYVTVKQIAKDANNITTDKGKTIYKFRSPIDFPNPDVLSSEMPILPITNHDYLRGQMVFEKKYDAGGKILSEVNNEYTTLVFEKLEGVKVKDNFYNNINPAYYNFTYYDAFKGLFPNVVLSSPYKYYSEYGITLPSERRELSYFYNNGVQNSTVSLTKTTYNQEDYPLNVTQIIPDGAVSVSNYQYAHEKNNQKLITANMIGTPLETTVVEKPNETSIGKTVSRSETKYDDHTHLFPTSVVSYDIQNNTLSTEVTYNKYDAKGNILQYTTKDGIPTSIVWGYNSTQPIAKVQGATYDQLVNLGLITAIVNASDQDAANPANEPALITALDTFRKNSGLSSCQITTYTYDPLIGVTSITPPSGIREVYIYDTANRLKEIRQDSKTGNLVKEFKYNYKP